MKPKTKKIVIVIPCLQGGGAERVATLIANSLTRRNSYSVYLVNLEKGLSYYLDQKVQRIVLTSLDGKENKHKKLIHFPYQLFKLWRTLKKIKPDAVISFMERSSFMLWLLGVENCIYSFRSFQSNHIYKEDTEKSISLLRIFVYNFFIKNAHRKAKLITVVSEQAKWDLVANYNVPKDKIKVIYNPCDIEYISERKTESLEKLGFIFEYPVIINVGRLVKSKGQWWLIRVFSKLKEKFSDLKLVILGDGDLKSYLISLAEDLGMKVYAWNRNILNDNYDIYFLGYQKNPFKFISRAKIFILTSLWEGFPNALVEAMACGVPVISADCKSGPREILAPNTDFLKDAKKPEFAEYGILMPTFEDRFVSAFEPLTEVEKVWVEIISKVLKNEDIRKGYSEKGLKRVYDFHINKVIKDWEKILI